MRLDKFRKGFSDTVAHEAFINAVHEGDADEIAAVLDGLNIERPHVDTLVNAAPRQMRPNATALSAKVPERPIFGSADYMKELQVVVDVASMRDTPLEQLDGSLPEGMRMLSPWLADVDVNLYAPGVDYGTSEMEFKAIQSGADIRHPITGEMTKIKTGRDASAFVHSDDPMEPWVRLMKDMIAEGVACAMPKSMRTHFRAQQNFTQLGVPFFLGMLGACVRDGGYVSFHNKWKNMEPRPEESAPVLGLGFLPLAYAEGSPMHPSDPAMHSEAACTCKYLLLKFFDNDHVLSTGRTVFDEATLLADNIGYFRVHAGVHFMADHLSADAVSKVHVESMCQGFQLAA